MENKYSSILSTLLQISLKGILTFHNIYLPFFMVSAATFSMFPGFFLKPLLSSSGIINDTVS